MYKLIGLVFVVAMSTSALAQLEYWAAVRNVPGPNEIHLFDGPNLIRVVEQFRGAAWDPVGFGDGASSPHQGFFFGWDGGVVAYNNDGTGPFLRISGPPPEIDFWRALAFDPTGIRPPGSLWAASLTSALIEVDLRGTLLTLFPNPGVSIHALAFDETDDNLWALTSNGDIVKIDTNDGSLIPGQGWTAQFPNAAWFGLGALRDRTGRVAAVGDTKLVIYGDPALGPWDLPAEAYMGLAIAVGPCAGQLCGDANCDGRFDGADIDAFFCLLSVPGCCKHNCPCDILCTHDINGDGAVNGGDIDPFFEALV